VENDLPNMSNEKLVIHMPVASATTTLFISQTAALGELCEHEAPLAGWQQKYGSVENLHAD
jgi:hypothetical protein